MFDMIDIQNSFYLFWAERLWRDDYELWKAIPKLLLKKVGGCYSFSSNVSSKDFKGINLIKNVFWEKVLSTWLDLNFSSNNRTDYIHINSPLFNNTLITYKNKTIFSQHCCKKSIVKVGDVVDHGEFIEFALFQQKFGHRPDVLLTYNILYNALFKHLKNLSSLIPLTTLSFRNHQIGTNSRKLYLKLIKKTETPFIESFWGRKFNTEFDKLIWLLPYKCTIETRLRILQWKILHNIYPTSILLKKMKIRDSDLCIYCNTIDTIEHFFFDCGHIKSMWKEIEKLITKHTNHIMSLDARTVLLGALPKSNLIKSKVNVINLLILIGKLVISKCKYGIINNPIILLEKEIFARKLS